MNAELIAAGRLVVNGAIPATKSGQTCFVPRYQIDRLRDALDGQSAPPTEHEMTNAELSDAIAMAFSMVGESDRGEARHQEALLHIRELLAIQRNWHLNEILAIQRNRADIFAGIKFPANPYGATNPVSQRDED